MRPFPLCRFTIETTLAPHQVQARLRNAIAVKWTFGFSESDRPFVGQFDGTLFDITRADGQRSSFCPRIHGSIQPRAKRHATQRHPSAAQGGACHHAVPAHLGRHSVSLGSCAECHRRVARAADDRKPGRTGLSGRHDVRWLLFGPEPVDRRARGAGGRVDRGRPLRSCCTFPRECTNHSLRGVSIHLVSPSLSPPGSS